MKYVHKHGHAICNRDYSKENFGLHIYGERGARAYNGGLGAEPPAGGTCPLIHPNYFSVMIFVSVTELTLTVTPTLTLILTLTLTLTLNRPKNNVKISKNL